METPKPRSGNSEVPKKVSPRAARQLKVSPVGFGSSSPAASPSTKATRTPQERSSKIPDRKSPKSPVIPEKKRPSRLTELETQISELQNDLKKAKDELTASKASKQEAKNIAEELQQQLSAVSLKLEESQNQLADLKTSKEADVAELKGISEEKDRAWETRLDIIHKQHSIDASALTSALGEIETLKKQLEMVTQCDETTDIELQSLKSKLSETLLVFENMKTEIESCKENEALAKGLVHETLSQLEEAKQTVNALRNDGVKSMEDHKSVASELEDSRARVSYLENIVNKLKSHLEAAATFSGEQKSEIVSADHESGVDELIKLRSEVRKLKSFLEAAECRQSKNTDELEAELIQAKCSIDELKANLMDKETELQFISEENASLNLKIKVGPTSYHQEENPKNESKWLEEEVSYLKANLMDKETELQNIKEENEILKSNSTQSVDQEKTVKIEVIREEHEQSKKRAESAAEQLEAAQAANAELEAELRRLKVQSDQWRKAAEAAASMLSSPVGNGRLVQRTSSLGSPVTARMNSPYLDEYDEDEDDDDAFKKKNGNVLKKIGGFWKKPQK